MYILKIMFINLEIITQKFGHFLLTPDMIGFTAEEECKFWINEDFNKNQVQHPLNEDFGQKNMVENLLNVVEGTINQGDAEKEFI